MPTGIVFNIGFTLAIAFMPRECHASTLNPKPSNSQSHDIFSSLQVGQIKL
jgi:hypothetical protein